MSTDTLSYKYHYQAKKADLFRVLIREQLTYFRRSDPTIKALEPGTKIQTHLQTKLNKLETENTMVVKQIVTDELFQLETTQQGGVIVQTFKFEQDRHGRERLVYSEQNTFDQSRSQMNFMVMGGLYKFFYNRGIKKRMQYLDNLALSA